jgi:16S rRNA (guanine527-N7)-methyltransferase
VFHVKHRPGEGAPVSRETRLRLEVYAGLLTKWNRKINLIGRQTEPDLWRRHVEDSLQLMPYMPATATRAIDLGSGGGFPGLVLAIATGIAFDLVESDQRKCAFLREVAAATGAPATIHAVRIEAAQLEPAELVTARALAPVADLLPLAARLLAPTGVALFLKGARAEQELTAAQTQWHMRVERYPSVTDPNGVILRLSEVQRA